MTMTASWLRYLIWIPAVALLLTMIIAAGNASAATVGQDAPAFTLKDPEGKDISLADYKGKVVVLEWFNNGCPFVHKHYDSHNMQDLQKEMTAKGVVWLTISSSAEGQQGYETAASAKETIAKFGINATDFLLDSAGTVGRLYDAKTTPHMFVVDKDGKLAYAGAIDDKPSADPADIKGAKNYVRQAVDEVLAGKPVSEPATKSYGCGVKYAE